MSNISIYAANKLLDHLLDTATYTPIPLYVAMLTVTPSMPGGAGLLEVPSSGTGYGRVQATGKMAAASGGSVTNNADLVWNQATGNWGTLTGAALFDSPVVGSGNLIAAGALYSSKTINAGDAWSIPVGQLILAFV